MQYFDALFPSIALATIFTIVILRMLKNQGGTNKGREDAAVDAAISARQQAIQAHQAAQRERAEQRS
ncbi:hypothetical protein BIV57_11735 [Mangrovactinospora gilvigrisea]|uniref:Uncharacterized protein n=1 Tax=Mangrovactinospora gilvigrisea TaxID=1428644 RepID=A0A1J7BV07_9ACTN|nr:hypothetical protein [Mangrovactinospora gilvigrisea]OIV37313.1 hypothetical protein BIV57_11735 [Mangrovactinospora gilvigrisea]